MSSIQKTQVAVVGGGSGGYAAAFMAADLGLEVTLINAEEKPGGTCLYRGCIPSKALLHVAKLIYDVRDAEHYGVHCGELRINLDQVRQSTQKVVNQLTGGLGQLCDARKVRYIQGRATLSDSHTLAVFREDGDERARDDHKQPVLEDVADAEPHAQGDQNPDEPGAEFV